MADAPISSGESLPTPPPPTQPEGGSVSSMVASSAAAAAADFIRWVESLGAEKADAAKAALDSAATVATSYASAAASASSAYAAASDLALIAKVTPSWPPIALPSILQPQSLSCPVRRRISNGQRWSTPLMSRWSLERSKVPFLCSVCLIKIRYSCLIAVDCLPLHWLNYPFLLLFHQH
jgi:hypothetical protein